MNGENVMLLVHTEDRPTWAVAQIASRNPFSVQFDSSFIDLFKGVKNMLVIHDSGRKYAKGEGRVGDLSSKGDQAWLTFNDFHWETVENRDNPRFEHKSQVIIRTIQEHDGEVAPDDQVGMTQNLSLGGALIEFSRPVIKGQLVDFRITLDPGQTIRTMAVIAHTDKTGTIAGLTFVDYIGSARYALHQYLSKLAA